MTGGPAGTYPALVPSDEELRKVAEDLRALARSLARDIRQAADAARGSGQSAGDAFRHGLRDVADEAKRNLRQSFGPPRHAGARPGHGRRPPPYYGQPWARTAQQRRGEGGSGPAPGVGWPGHPTGRPGCEFFGRARHRPRYAPPPPLRHRWDATAVVGTLAVLFGAAWLFGVLSIVHLPIEAVVAIGLMLLGVAVIITARTDWSLSRHSWPVLLGAAMIVVLVATSATFGVQGALGHISFGNMARAATGPQPVYGGFGNLTVDATGTTSPDVVVQSIAGRTVILTPPDRLLIVDARVTAGQICVEGQAVAAGFGASVSQSFKPTSSPATLAGGPAPGSVPNASPGGATSTGQAVTVTVHQLLGRILIDGQGCSRP